MRDFRKRLCVDSGEQEDDDSALPNADEAPEPTPPPAPAGLVSVFEKYSRPKLSLDEKYARLMNKQNNEASNPTEGGGSDGDGLTKKPVGKALLSAPRHDRPVSVLPRSARVCIKKWSVCVY